MSTALIVVDVQNDFCEGGALPVTGGNKVAADIAEYLRRAEGSMEVVFTRDWHEPLPSTNGGHFGDPPDFVDSWPVHCVQGTKGAEFHPALSDFEGAYPVFSKGMGRPDYSGFQGFKEPGQELSLPKWLSRNDVTKVLVCGLAADYCVRATALDAVKAAFPTTILTDLTAGIAKSPEDVTDEIDLAQQVD